jgi:isovaleryl-CoA dehydrogenase
MQLGWTSAQQELRERFLDFGRRQVSFGTTDRDRDGDFDLDLWKSQAELGLWRLPVPRQDGGLGGSWWDFLAAFEGLAAGADDFGFLMSTIAHAGLIRVLLAHGTAGQRARFLPGLLGGQVGATAATEESGGSHVARIGAAAVPSDSGYRLSGEKCHITNAPIADVLLIVGRVPSLGARDITLFLLASSSPGLSLGGHEDLLGQRSSPTGSVRLDRVPVTEGDVLGGMGRGLETLYSFLAFDRLMYAVAVAGALELVLQRGMDRAHSRSAFGRPIADHQYVQDKLVDIKLTMEAARWLGYSAMSGLVAGDSQFSSQASLAKLVASEGMVRAGLELIQIFGHTGYERRNGVDRVVRDAIALRLAGGSTEMMKKNVFKILAETSRTRAAEPLVADGAES